jgi:hypothetical protein
VGLRGNVLSCDVKPPRISRPALTVLAAAALLVAGSTGGAIAGSMITGAQIKNNTVTSADIKNSTLKKVDLSASAVKALRGARGAQGLPGADGAPGAQGDPGPAGPTNTKTLALVADTSTGDASKSVSVGDFTIGVTCRSTPPPGGPDLQDFVGLNTNDFQQMYVLSPTPDVFVAGAAGFFPAGDSTVHVTAVSRDGQHSITAVATRWRVGNECRVALSASASD